MHVDKKRLIIIASAALAAFTAIAVVLRAKIADSGPVLKDGAAIERIKFEGKIRDVAYVRLPYARSTKNARFRFVNVLADLNGDGAVAAYDVSGRRQEEWLVRNMPTFVAEGASDGFPFMLVDGTAVDRLPLKGTAVFSKDPLDAGAKPDTLPSSAKTETFTVKAAAVSEVDEALSRDAKDGRRTGAAVGGGGAVPAGGAAPAAPADPYEYGHQMEGMADPNQEYNECAPTSVANNLRWLAKKYGFEDRMPSDLSSAIDELKGDTLWDDGAMEEDILPGKQAFIRRHQLPLEAHVIGGEDDPMTLYKIYQELEKGQVVELDLDCYDRKPDGTYRPAGGHLAAVGGVTKVGSDRFVRIVDSATKASSDGEAAETYAIDGTTLKYYWCGDKTKISHAFVQSPVFGPDGRTLVYPDQNVSMMAQPGESPRPPSGDLALSRAKFGFFNVAVDDPGDHMVGETFTVRAGVTWTGRKESMPYWDADDKRHVYQHSSGKPWTLTGAFRGRGAAGPAEVLKQPFEQQISDRRFIVETKMTCVKPGRAVVSYSSYLSWPRVGGEPPAELLPRYAAQLKTQDAVVVDSPPFRCLSPYQAPPSTVAREPFTCPGIEEDPDGKEVDVLKIDGKCYPAFQFHIGEPDACKARHWHWNHVPVKSLDGGSRPDPNPSECGFGKVGEVQTGRIKVNPDQVAPFLSEFLKK
jgi:hypothetical protein